jgi:hypothetical protein
VFLFFLIPQIESSISNNNNGGNASSGNACYHSVQSFVFSINLKIKIYKSVTLTFGFYGCETLSQTNERTLIGV